MNAAVAKGQVGIIGLGIMGGAIARNLSAAGWQVIGHDIDAARTHEAAAAGVAIEPNAAAVAAKAQRILTSLPTPDSLQATATAIAGAQQRCIVAELSTFSLADKGAAERVLAGA